MTPADRFAAARGAALARLTTAGGPADLPVGCIADAIALAIRAYLGDVDHEAPDSQRVLVGKLTEARRERDAALMERESCKGSLRALNELYEIRGGLAEEWQAEAERLRAEAEKLAAAERTIAHLRQQLAETVAVVEGARRDRDAAESQLRTCREQRDAARLSRRLLRELVEVDREMGWGSTALNEAEAHLREIGGGGA